LEETAVEASIELLERSQLNGTNSSDCLSAEEQKTLSMAVASVSFAASLACILAIIFTLASKGYKEFVHRLTLYLTVASLIEAVMSIHDVILVHHNGTAVVVRNGFEGICAVCCWVSISSFNVIGKVSHLLDCAISCFGFSAQMQC